MRRIGTLPSSAAPTGTAPKWASPRAGARHYVISPHRPGKKAYVPPIPEHDVPNFDCQYDGPEILKVAYILDRNPTLTATAHPVAIEMARLQDIHSKYYARTQYTSPFDYFPAWKKANAELTKELAKLKLKKADLGRNQHVKVPDPPEDMSPIQPSPYTPPDEMKKIKKKLDWLRYWKPAPRFTQDDIDDNRYSINRKLMNRLYFIVKNRETGLWEFPTGIRRNPDTMRFAASRKFYEDMGSNLRAYFISNAPLGHIVTPTPPDAPKEITFFYHVLYLKGRPPFKARQKEWADHAWVTRKELTEYEMAPGHKQYLYDLLWDGFVCA